MTKKSKGKEPKENTGSKGGEKHGRKDSHRAKMPNRPLLALSGAGVLLTGYLTALVWFGEKPALCDDGSSCDLVQSSQWGSLLGMPVSFWGLLTYGVLVYIAVKVRKEGLQWRMTWFFSLVGLSVSLYLTSISLFVLDLACMYCLASLVLMASIFGLTVYRRPASVTGFTWKGWLGETAIIGAGAAIVVHLFYMGLVNPMQGPEDPYLKSLAEHLSSSGAKFYGAEWCGACAKQKSLFKTSVARLPYVECSPNGRSAPRAPVCTEKGISSYPTWIIGGIKTTGVLEPQKLAQVSHYTKAPQ